MPVPPNPTIEIHSEGLIAVAAKHGNPISEVGILKTSDHTRIFQISKFIGGLRVAFKEFFGSELDDTYSVTVSDAAQSGIRLFTTDTPVAFNRAADEGDPQDYRWGLEVESLHQVPCGALTVDRSKFGPILSLDNALFYTKKKSPTQAILIKPGQPPATIGHISVVTGANIYLGGGGTAVLKNSQGMVQQFGNGEEMRFSAAGGATYSIVCINTCPPTLSANQQEADFMRMYSAIGTNLPEDDRINIDDVPTPTGDPNNPFINTGDCRCTGMCSCMTTLG